MRTVRTGWAWVAAASVCACAAAAEERKPAVAPPVAVWPQRAPGAVVKEIADPVSGVRWFLVEDPAHPGGPGRLVAMGAGIPAAGAAVLRAKAAEPVIHPGDRVQVEEHSMVVDASLEAIALGAAFPGGALHVRLRVGGRVVVAMALGPGRAELAPAGARP